MDVTHIPELAVKSAYPVMMARHAAVPGVRDQIADIRFIEPGTMYGDKGTTIIGGSRLIEREDGAGFAQDRMEKGWTWQIKVRNYGKELPLDNRLIEASSSTEIGNIIAEWAASVAQNSAYQKEQFVADLLQKGTLTAGDSIFDGSFPGNDDPNPLFIYDGLPLFDTAHTIKVGSGTYANHVASSALSSANLTSAKVLMQQTSAVDDRGERIMNMAQSLIVPPSMEATARVLLNSQQLPGSPNNDVNIHQGTLGLIVNPFLSDTASVSAWWLKMSEPGIRFYEQRGGPAVRVYQKEETNQTIVQLNDYWGGGATNWRGLGAFNKAAS